MWLWIKCSRYSSVCILLWWALSFPDSRWADPVRHTACHKTKRISGQKLLSNSALTFHGTWSVFLYQILFHSVLVHVILSRTVFKPSYSLFTTFIMSHLCFFIHFFSLSVHMHLCSHVSFCKLKEQYLILTHVRAVMHSQAPVPTVTYDIFSTGIPDCLNT